MVNFETTFAQNTPWMGAISIGEYGDPKTQLKLLRDLSPPRGFALACDAWGE